MEKRALHLTKVHYTSFMEEYVVVGNTDIYSKTLYMMSIWNEDGGLRRTNNSGWSDPPKARWKGRNSCKKKHKE